MVKLKITKFVKILSLVMAFMTLFGAMAIIPDMPISAGMTVHAAANGNGTYRITTSAGLNMRAGPSTGYKKIIAIPYNTNVDVSNIRGNWGQTTYKGRSGWICLDYATKVNVGPYVPVKLPLSNGEYYIASALNNNKFVDCADASTSNGANVLLWDAHYGDNQKVQVTYLDNGCYKIVFKHSGKCLDVAEVSKKSGANVHQWAYGGGANQQWILADAGNGYFYIIAQHSGKCLDVSGANTANGTNIQVYDPNKTNAQKFKFIPASSVTINTPSVIHEMRYVQSDSSWSKYKYGGGNLKDTGCGVFALVNAVYALTGHDMGVTSVAQWAHDINAYNPGKTAEGTTRDKLYPNVTSKYSSQYGFKIENSGYGYWENATSTRLINHLKNGGVAIVHVPSHFIAIVDYDASSEKFLVYDSYPTSSRGTSRNGDWKTVSQLSTGKMKVDWFCLLSKTTATGGTSNAISYFPACSSSHTSIVSALNSIGASSNFSYRKQIAAANNISGYSGTASQNKQMLNLLKAGKLIKP